MRNRGDVRVGFVVAVLAAGLFGAPAGATVSGTYAPVSTVAAGATQFYFNFQTSPSDTTWIQVYLNGVLQTGGYTVSLNANQSSSPGGSVAFSAAPASGTVVLIQRAVPSTQLLHYPVGGAFPSAASEGALDKLMMVTQQKLDKTAFKGPWNSSTTYQPGDVASYSGTSYVAIATSTNSQPPSTNWLVLAQAASADATAANVTANGTTTALPLASWMAMTVNVKALGAKGDGTTDDTVAVQAAASVAGQGGTVVVPIGTYQITSTIQIPAGQRWVGASIFESPGQYGAILRWGLGTAGVVARLLGPQNRIEGVTFHGNSVAVGLQAKANSSWTGYGSSCVNCRFTSCTNGFEADPNDNSVSQNDTWSFENSLFDSNQYGVYINTLQADFWTFRSSNWSGNTIASVYAAVATGSVRFEDCVFVVAPKHIVITNGTGGGGAWTVIHSQSEGAPSNAYFLDASGDVSINLLGCTINQKIKLNLGGRPFTTISNLFNVGYIETVNQAQNWISIGDRFMYPSSTGTTWANWKANAVSGAGLNAIGLYTGSGETTFSAMSAISPSGIAFTAQSSPASEAIIQGNNPSGSKVFQVGYQGQIEQAGKLFWRLTGYPVSGGRPDAAGSPWVAGDVIFNSAPAIGSPMGWVCTVGGTPGTWRPMPNL